MRLYENWPQVLKPFKRLVEKLFIHWHAGIGRGHFFIADICDLITEHDRLLTFCLLHCAIVCPPPGWPGGCAMAGSCRLPLGA